MKYVFLSTKNPKWYIEIQYVRNKLKAVHLNSKLQQMSDEKLQVIFNCICQKLADTETKLNALGFVMDQEQKAAMMNPTALRIAAWKDSWEAHTGFAYVMTKQDAYKLNLIDIPEEEFKGLVSCYMNSASWFAESKSLGGFIKHINTIRDEFRNGTTNKATSEFGSIPSKVEEAKIKDTKILQRYWQHFRSLGFRKNKRTGEWKKIPKDESNR